MLIRQHESLIEGLDVQLGFKGPVTSNGGVLTLPAAAADLKDWINDPREFQPLRQHDDWMQVIGDFHESVLETGPKLTAAVGAVTTQIEQCLQRLFSSEDGPPRIDSAVRGEIQRYLDQLDIELVSDAAIVAAWRDLCSSSEKPNRKSEEVYYRRDTLWALAERRNLDTESSFGVFRDVSAVLRDNANAVQEELDRAAGVEHQPVFPPTWEPSGVPTWRRLQLCEQVFTREPYRADCIVWLRLAPTSLPQHEVSWGPVTFYNASYLSAFIGQPEFADRFQVPPMEVLKPLPPELEPILEDGEVEWEDDWHMAYARVELRAVEVHSAESRARTLVQQLIAINHPPRDTWILLNGTILFINSERHSPFSWGPRADMADPFYPQNDSMGRDIEVMPQGHQSMDGTTMDRIEEVVAMSAALKRAAADNDSQATIVAAVRVIEHMNAWTTGGAKHWADFASDYFKKAQSRMRFVGYLNYFTKAAIDHVPDRRPSASTSRELSEIRSRLMKYAGPNQVFHSRGAVDEVDALRRLYADHWLARGLGEVQTMLATPEGMRARLEEQGRRFDRHLKRLKRLRNSLAHGGPVSDLACKSVDVFADNLGHQCLGEAINALLKNCDIAAHMADYRQDHIERYERASATGDVDALYVAAAFDVENQG